MADAAREAVKALNWLAIAYAAETVSAPALTLPQPLAGLAAIAASLVAFKASRVAGKASKALDRRAELAALFMMAASIAQAATAIIAPGEVKVAYTIFLAAAAAYSALARIHLRGVGSRASEGAALAAVGAAIGALAPSTPGLTIGLLLYLAGVHTVMRGMVESGEGKGYERGREGEGVEAPKPEAASVSQKGGRTPGRASLAWAARARRGPCRC